jgi:hypothetical protein
MVLRELQSASMVTRVRDAVDKGQEEVPRGMGKSGREWHTTIVEKRGGKLQNVTFQ